WTQSSVKLREWRLPKLNGIAFGIVYASESSCFGRIPTGVGLDSDVREPQLGQKLIQLGYPKVDHPLLTAGRVVGGISERQKHRWTGFLIPGCAFFKHDAKMISIPLL